MTPCRGLTINNSPCFCHIIIIIMIMIIIWGYAISFTVLLVAAHLLHDYFGTKDEKGTYSY